MAYALLVSEEDAFTTTEKKSMAKLKIGRVQWMRKWILFIRILLRSWYSFQKKKGH